MNKSEDTMNHEQVVTMLARLMVGAVNNEKVHDLIDKSDTSKGYYPGLFSKKMNTILLAACRELREIKTPCDTEFAMAGKPNDDRKKNAIYKPYYQIIDEASKLAESKGKLVRMSFKAREVFENGKKVYKPGAVKYFKPGEFTSNGGIEADIITELVDNLPEL